VAHILQFGDAEDAVSYAGDGFASPNLGVCDTTPSILLNIASLTKYFVLI